MRSVFRMLPLLIALYLGMVYAKNHSDLRSLIKNLTSNYDTKVRPTFDLDTPTIVMVSFILSGIKYFDEKNSRLEITGSLHLMWHDFQMTWEPEDHAGISTFLIPQSEIWTPAIVLTNSYSKPSPLGNDKMDVRTSYHGDLFWITYDVYDIVCTADVTFYPFDTHTCTVTFQPWLYIPNGELKLVNMTDNVNLDYFHETSTWKLPDTKSYIIDTDEYQVFNVEITFKRRPMFHVINILVPISIMGLLGVLVFVLPAESGERVGFSITVLLAMAVYLTIITDNLPSASEPSIPIICYMLIVDLGIGSLVTVCTILGLRFHHKLENEAVPSWAQFIICRKWRGKGLKKAGNLKSSMDTETINNAEDENRSIYVNTSMNQDRRGICVSNRLVNNDGKQIQYDKHTIQRMRNRQEDINEWECEKSRETLIRTEKMKWKNVADVCDIAFFVLFLVLIISKNIITFILLDRLV